MIIRKAAVAKFLDGLLKEYAVYIPRRREGYSEYTPLDPGSGYFWQGLNTQKPPKELLFPHGETLYSYRLRSDGVELRTHFDEEKRVLFGIRPCDAKGFCYLDRVFTRQDYQDVYYQTRRNNTVLIGLACLAPTTTCFCTSLGGGPFDTEGLDLLWVDLGERYAVRVLTPKGEALIKGRPEFVPAGEADWQAVRELEGGALGKMAPVLDLSGLKKRLDENYSDSVWDRVFEKCIGCAACTYLCPTCHCFDLSYEVEGSQGLCVRTWDSCAFPLFTLHASGHNPRPTGKERFRQRVMHKFRYFVENWGVMSCVGCGRCIIHCPVNLDIRDVLRQIIAGVSA